MTLLLTISTCVSLQMGCRAHVQDTGTLRHPPCIMINRKPVQGERGFRRYRLRQVLRSFLGKPAEALPPSPESEDHAPVRDLILPSDAGTPSVPVSETSSYSPSRQQSYARWTADETERLSASELSKVRSNPNDPANPAEILREAGAGARVLDEMELACCWLHFEAASEELRLPRFVVTARPSKILEPELRQMALVLR